MEDNRNANELELKDTCMLVSDSDEVHDQLDSKQLQYKTLFELAEEDLFKKHLDMSRYLTLNQYEAYKRILSNKLKTLSDMKSTLESNILNPPNYDKFAEFNSKLRVVKGQVILLKASEIPENMSPTEYVKLYWDINAQYKLSPIPDCMLRGILDTMSTQLGQSNRLVAEKVGNEKVDLKNENIPPHMHHSSVTQGQGFTTMTHNTDTTYWTKGNLTYDMFYNDSMDIGLSKNELDGTIDGFEVVATGKNEGTQQTGVMMAHDNMPKFQSFYGFVVEEVM